MLLALFAVAGIWLVAWGGYLMAQRAKMTAEKVRQYASSIDLSKLTGRERAEALRKLEEKINQLSWEERRKWRKEAESKDWFVKMTESEKGQFIEATMPTGFKQMLNAFEDMPADRRKKELDTAMKRVKEMSAAGASQTNGMSGTNTTQEMSPELQKKMMTIGLKAFYGQSSAETKVELSPVLEELQHRMESGARPFR
jgi:hypothetical protein